MSLLFRPVLSRCVAGLAALLALSACDPRFVHKSDLSTREIVSLSGAWSGRGTLSFSSRNDCVKVYLWSLHVANGNADGTLVDERTPEATPGSFTTFVEYDGSLHASVRTRGHDFALLGSFNHDGFRGTARSDEGCNYTVSLSRRGPAS